MMIQMNLLRMISDVADEILANKRTKLLNLIKS